MPEGLSSLELWKRYDVFHRGGTYSMLKWIPQFNIGFEHSWGKELELHGTTMHVSKRAHKFK